MSASASLNATLEYNESLNSTILPYGPVSFPSPDNWECGLEKTVRVYSNFEHYKAIFANGSATAVHWRSICGTGTGHCGYNAVHVRNSTTQLFWSQSTDCQYFDDHTAQFQNLVAAANSSEDAELFFSAHDAHQEYSNVENQFQWKNWGSIVRINFISALALRELGQKLSGKNLQNAAIANYSFAFSAAKTGIIYAKLPQNAQINFSKEGAASAFSFNSATGDFSAKVLEGANYSLSHSLPSPAFLNYSITQTTRDNGNFLFSAQVSGNLSGTCGFSGIPQNASSVRVVDSSNRLKLSRFAGGKISWNCNLQKSNYSALFETSAQAVSPPSSPSGTIVMAVDKVANASLPSTSASGATASSNASGTSNADGIENASNAEIKSAANQSAPANQSSNPTNSNASAQSNQNGSSESVAGLQVAPNSSSAFLQLNSDSSALSKYGANPSEATGFVSNSSSFQGQEFAGFAVNGLELLARDFQALFSNSSGAGLKKSYGVGGKNDSLSESEFEEWEEGLDGGWEENESVVLEKENELDGLRGKNSLSSPGFGEENGARANAGGAEGVAQFAQSGTRNSSKAGNKSQSNFFAPAALAIFSTSQPQFVLGLVGIALALALYARLGQGGVRVSKKREKGERGLVQIIVSNNSREAVSDLELSDFVSENAKTGNFSHSPEISHTLLGTRLAWTLKGLGAGEKWSVQFAASDGGKEEKVFFRPARLCFLSEKGERVICESKRA